MYRAFIFLFGVFLTLFPHTGLATEVTYETVSRCFFVYAPIFETGRDSENQLVFQYGQKRIAWAGGYMQAQEKNLEFNRVFERNLARNKKDGIAIKIRLTNALSSRNVDEYSSVMSIARQCDEQLGLPSNDIPSP